MTRRVALACAVVILTTALMAQQASAPGPVTPPDVTFKVEVNYVEVDAVATDARGAIVKDLRPEEFELIEDGKRQQISSLAFVDVPVERPERPLFSDRPIEPDVFTNGGAEGRLYLIVLDDLHTASTRTGRVRRVAREFIEHHFGANDYAAVAFTGGRESDGQYFTSNPRLLLAAIDKFVGQKLQSPTLAKMDVMQRAPQDPLQRVPDPRVTGRGNRTPVTVDIPDPNLQPVAAADPFADERNHRARQMATRLRELTEAMGSVRGRRKAMLFIGEGTDYDIDDVLGSTMAWAVAQDSDEAVAAATRANVSIYTIDPRVVEPAGDELIQVMHSQATDDANLGAPSLRRELELAQASLRFLANGTGGFAALNRSEFTTAFDRIVRENSSYYLLGFYPSNDRREGRYRKLQVRVTRPGVRITHARSGYNEPRSADAPGPARPADGAPPSPAGPVSTSLALTSPLPLSGLPLKVFAGPYKGHGSEAAIAVAIEADLKNLPFEESDGRFTEHLEVSHVAIDPRGGPQQYARQPIDLSVTREGLEAVRRNGVRVLSVMLLKPGRYQLRAAVVTSSGRTGSVIRDLEIPDYGTAPLAMSAVSLTSTLARQVTTASRIDLLRSLLEGPLTASREFSRREELVAYAEVYENEPHPSHTVELHTRASAEGGATAFDLTEHVRARDGAGPQVYPHRVRIPIRDLPPGNYVLDVEASSQIAPMRSVKRALEFRVVE
jgi:VWFA-related protein